MNKVDFLTQLRKGLAGLPQDDIEERLLFYSEMIDDQMEEGILEEEAVSAAGAVDEIADQIILDTSLKGISSETIISKRRRNPIEMILLILGCPIWLSLAIAGVAVIFSLYTSLWVVVIALWAVFVSLAACSVASLPAWVIFTAGGNVASGFAVLASGFICAGLAIFLFLCSMQSVKGSVKLTRAVVLWVKKCVVRKGEA